MKRHGITIAVSAVLLLSAIAGVAIAAAWPFVIHQVTNDDLHHESVAVAGRHLYYQESRPTFHDDGTETHSPAVGWHYDRITGARTRIDPTSEAVYWLSAGGDWAVYHRSTDETRTAWAYNAVTRSRHQLDTPKGVAGEISTDGTFATWPSDDDYSVFVSRIGGTSYELSEKSAVYPAIDAGVVAWATHSQWTGRSTLFAHDLRSGTESSVTISGFSVLGIDISGDLIVAVGETPDYHSHLYIWNTRTGEVTRRYSAHPGYVSRARISGTRVVFNGGSPSGARQVRMLDLTSGTVTDVTPANRFGSAWNLDGSIIGLQFANRGEPIQAAWCDLDERPAPPDPPAPADAVTGDPLAPADASVLSPAVTPAPARRLVARSGAAGDDSEETTTAAAESTATPVPATSDAAVEAPLNTASEGAAADAGDASGSGTSSPLALALGALTGLAALGAGAFVLSRRRATT